MRKKIAALASLLIFLMIAGCGTTSKASLADGVYSADFKTDNSMFHVSEANNGKGVLTVKDGKMTIHVSLASENIINLFVGTADNAKKSGAKLLSPTTDTVTYSDGTTEEVYGYDIPVPAIDTEFDVALLGTKGTWYDHKVTVSNPAAADDTSVKSTSTDSAALTGSSSREDGSYQIAVTLGGGSGRASVETPASLTIANGQMTATIIWSSSNYDYMKIDGVEYQPVNTSGNSTFEIPVSAFDTDISITADTVAMSTPHEIDYTLRFDSATLTETAK